jgi:hypothetical protein
MCWEKLCLMAPTSPQIFIAILPQNQCCLQERKPWLAESIAAHQLESLSRHCGPTQVLPPASAQVLEPRRERRGLWLQALTSHSAWTLLAVLVPGRGLAAVLKTLPMFHDEAYARACGLPEDTLMLP